MPRLALLLAAVVLAATWSDGRLAAQPADLPPAAESESPQPPAGVGKQGVAGPDIFLLPDKSGKLRRVLGYRYEDFLQAWQHAAMEQATAEPPAFVLHSIAVLANADDDEARLQIVADVELQSESWIAAPLAFGAVIVDDTAIKDAGPRDFSSFDAEQQCYVAWLKGAPGQKRTITLTGHVALRRDGEGRRLELDLPPAAASTIDLAGPRTRVELESPSEAVTIIRSPADGATAIRVEGAKGRTALRWGPRNASAADLAASLEADVDQMIRLEPGRLSYDTAIRLNAFGQPVKAVRVRLPAGTTASTAAANAGYDVVPVTEPADSPRDADVRPIVEVRFHDATPNPPEVRLAAEKNQSSSSSSSTYEAGSFEVIGAFRQRGAASIRVSDQFHAHFDLAGPVEQIDAAELPEGFAGDSPTAAFATSGPDWRLTVNTQPRQRRVRLTPRYELHLGAQGAAMNVVLDYQITGARTFDLRLDLRGWELAEQPIESAGAVDLAEQHVTADQILIMPLKDPGAQQVRVRFLLRREAGLGAHDLPLPEAIDAVTLPGALAVTCDEAWRAVPRLDASLGLALASEAPRSTSSAPPSTPVAASRDSSAVVLQTLLPRARLAVDVDRRERVIDALSAVSVQIEGYTARAEQRLQFDVRYQAATEIAATLANELVANEALELICDGQPVSASALEIRAPRDASPTADPDSKVRMVVKLPRPTVGRVDLVIRSAWTLGEAERSGSAMTSVPLAIPEQSAKTSATVVSATENVRVGLWPVGDSSAWTVVPPEATSTSAGGPSALFVEAANPVDSLPLRLEPATLRDSGDLRVDATWAQTWIAGGLRQDRVVFRIRTTGAFARLVLPSDWTAESTESLVNGEVTSGDRSPADQLLLPLPPSESSPAYTIELRRQAPLTFGAWDSLRADFPRVVGTHASSPAVWQLVLPPDMAALGAPASMTAEYRLGWQRYQWGRQPTQTQADLERWTAAATAPEPAPTSPQYVYSAFELPRVIEMGVVRRIWIIVAVGLASLAVGLAWLYTKAARSMAFWLALCVGVGATLFMFPEAALLFAQAALVGAGLTLLSWATRWLLSSPPRPQATISSPPSSIASHTAATQPWISEPVGSSVASAPSYRSSGNAT